MTAIPSMNGQAPMPLSDGTLPVDPALVTNTLLQALLQTARAASSSGHSGAEAKDYALAALNLSQAIVVLDPSLSQGGTPIAHDLLIKDMEHASNERVAGIQASAQVEMARTQAASSRAAAAAPTPARGKAANP